MKEKMGLSCKLPLVYVASPYSALVEYFDPPRDAMSALQIAAGLEMLSRCDYIYVANHVLSACSRGIKAELEFAAARGIGQLDF